MSNNNSGLNQILYLTNQHATEIQLQTLTFYNDTIFPKF